MKDILHAYFESYELSKRLFINAPIVHLNIEQFLSSSDEADGDMHERLMYRFEDYADGLEKQGECDGVNRFCKIMRSLERFPPTINGFYSGYSFSQLALLSQPNRERTGLVTMCACGDCTIVSMIALFVP